MNKEQEIYIRMQQGMRALSEEEMAEEQKKAVPGMRAMTEKEIAEHQVEGFRRLYGAGKRTGEA